MNKEIKIFLEGVIGSNPVLRMVLGMCSTLAITTLALNGLIMGISVTAVLLASETMTSLMRPFVPNRVRMPVYIVVVATFVTAADMLLHAYMTVTYELLGVFIPLIVVNCIIFARIEIFSSKNMVMHSFIDALGSGLGYTIVLLILSSIREMLGFGTIFGYHLPLSLEPLAIMALPPGAFLALALLMALMNYLNKEASGNA